MKTKTCKSDAKAATKCSNYFDPLTRHRLYFIVEKFYHMNAEESWKFTSNNKKSFNVKVEE